MKKLIFINLFLLNSLFGDPLSEIAQRLHTAQKEQTIREQINKTDLAGGISADIFLIYDAEGELDSVVKCQRDADRSFLQEFEAMQLMQRMKFHHFDTPRPLAFDTFESEGKKHHFIHMSAVKGKTLNDLFKELPQLRGKKRLEQLSLIKEALYKTGMGLGELHARSSQYKKGLSPAYQDDLTHVAQGFLHLVKNHSRQLKISLSEAETMVQKLLTTLDLGEAGITHCDLHPGNILYDPSTERISFIDFNLMVPSLQGPIGGPIALDYAATLGYIDQFCSLVGHLNEDERRSFITAFVAGYQTQRAEPKPEVVETLMTLFYMEQVLCFFNYQNESEAMVAQAQNFTNFAREQIKSYHKVFPIFAAERLSANLAKLF